MKKENKNIFLHIIDEDYKGKNQKQNEAIDVSGKAIQLIDQKDASVIERLRKMHGNFEATEESEQPADELNQTKRQELCDSMNLHDVSELYVSLQELKTEEQELLDQKQDLLSMEQDLREKLANEIDKKKKTIEALRLEISALQNICSEISQGLANN